MRIMTSRMAALALALASAGATFGQTSPAAQDRWARVRFLLGSWEGPTEGQSGKGTDQRRYQFALRDQFIEVRNTSIYPAQEKNAKGEVHEDVGYISFDRTRQRLVLRQFHVEGFVNQYVEDAPPSSGDLSFTSESIENIRPGWRARETYIKRGPDAFEEIFELAEAGKPFEVYSHARFMRVH